MYGETWYHATVKSNYLLPKALLRQSTCEGLWQKRLLEELRISTTEPMKVFCDILAAISTAQNHVQHDRMAACGAISTFYQVKSGFKNSEPDLHT